MNYLQIKTDTPGGFSSSTLVATEAAIRALWVAETAESFEQRALQLHARCGDAARDWIVDGRARYGAGGRLLAQESDTALLGALRLLGDTPRDDAVAAVIRVELDRRRQWRERADAAAAELRAARAAARRAAEGGAL